jgi:carnitine O-acetyltransferase
MSSSILRPIRPSDWKSAAPEPLPGTVTFAAQPTLPRLPVPDLKQTVDRLKESLKPIAWSDAEYSSAIRKIDTFANDLGPQLQQRLLSRANERPHWLEEWWDNIGYLGYRDSVHLYILASVHLSNIMIQVVVNVSYYCEDPDFGLPPFLVFICSNRWV